MFISWTNKRFLKTLMFNDGNAVRAIILSPGDTKRMPHLKAAERFRQCADVEGRQFEHFKSLKKNASIFISEVQLTRCL